jgi:hypothetical protein
MAHEILSTANLVLQRKGPAGDWVDVEGGRYEFAQGSEARDDMHDLRKTYGRMNVRLVRRSTVVTDTVVDNGR